MRFHGKIQVTTALMLYTEDTLDVLMILDKLEVQKSPL